MSEGATAGGGSVAGDDDGGDAGSGDEAPRSRMLDELRPDRGFVQQMPPPDAVTVGTRPDGGGFSLRPRLGALPPDRVALVAQAEEWADPACNAWSLMQGGADEFDDSAEHGYAFVSCVDSKKYVADERGMREIRIPQNHAEAMASPESAYWKQAEQVELLY